MEPERLVFEKPVTVLLSHSLYEDQEFLDFYELVIECVSPAGLEELKTERIGSIEGMHSKTCYHYMKFAFSTVIIFLYLSHNDVQCGESMLHKI